MEMIIRNIVKKAPSKRSRKASTRRSPSVLSKSIKLAKSASYGLGKLEPCDQNIEFYRIDGSNG
jgi:hypothetical protein